MSRVIISTTGTSIAGFRDPAVNWDDHGVVAQRIDQRLEVQRAKTGDAQSFRKLVSAEINSLNALKLNDSDSLYFLHSDTVDGQVCAEKVAKLAESEFGCAIEIICVGHLQATQADSFRKQGVQNLFRKLDEIRLKHVDETLVLNATGGFKSMVAYLSLYGLVYQADVVYLFERSDQLLRFPPAPINFDFARIERAGNALAVLREKEIMTEAEFFELIPGISYDQRAQFESLIESDGKDVALSAFGQLLSNELDRTQATIYLAAEAREFLNELDNNERRRVCSLLERMRDALWRTSHLHAFRGANLTVWKVPHTTYRICGFEEKDSVYVCVIYLDHDLYERELPTRKKSQFPREQFGLWVHHEVEDLLPAGDGAIENDLHREIAELKLQLKNLS